MWMFYKGVLVMLPPTLSQSMHIVELSGQFPKLAFLVQTSLFVLLCLHQKPWSNSKIILH